MKNQIKSAAPDSFNEAMKAFSEVGITEQMIRDLGTAHYMIATVMSSLRKSNQPYMSGKNNIDIEFDEFDNTMEVCIMECEGGYQKQMIVQNEERRLLAVVFPDNNRFVWNEYKKPTKGKLGRLVISSNEDNELTALSASIVVSYSNIDVANMEVANIEYNSGERLKCRYDGKDIKDIEAAELIDIIKKARELDKPASEPKFMNIAEDVSSRLQKDRTR